MDKVKNKKNYGQYFIIFLTSFLLGIIFSFNIGKNINTGMLKNTENGQIESIFNEKDFGLSKFWNEKDLDLSKFWEVFELIKLYNYDSDGINNEKMVDSAIGGLVEGLGDKHSEFLTTDETLKFNDILSGDFEGIGAVVEKNELGVIIERIIKGSPAKKYGLFSGDIIIKANDIKLEGLDLYDAVDNIKGKAGTSVMLEILRQGENNILKIEVIREKIKIPSVESKMFEDTKIGYIAINMFGEDTEVEFRKELELYLNTEGLIIDLRDNGGGYLQSAVSILGNFVEEDKNLVTTKYKDIFSNVSYPSFNEYPIYKGKIVVLINENSASASEITAGALKDYNKAILVGKKSYGKGSVQKPFDLSDGSMLKLTIAKWYTPNGINIDHEGIIPDIDVDFEKEDFENAYDRQLEVAKEVINVFIKNDAYKLSIDTYNNSLEKK